MERLLASALGEEPADTVFSGGTIFNTPDCSWEETSFAVTDGMIAGVGGYEGVEEVDLLGARVVPGLIDAHVHIESSLLVPTEFARAVLPHGTTTVIADPHEIANVAGLRGIEYLLEEASRSPLEIFFMLPSFCVVRDKLPLGGPESRPPLIFNRPLFIFLPTAWNSRKNGCELTGVRQDAGRSGLACPPSCPP